LFSEIEAFACANLVAKMEAGLLDAAPIWTDLKTLPWDEFRGKVDILSGGFPCQPFSCAGKRDGDEDPRHLFPYILDGIGRCRPSIVFLENVEGILSAKLSGDNWRDPAGTPVLLHVLRELERVGYKATAGIFSASEVGAPHQRKRVFIMAHRECARSQGLAWGVDVFKPRSEQGKSISEKGLFRGSEVGLAHPRSICAERANQDRANASGVCELSWRSEIRSEAIGCGNLWPSRPGQPQYEWEPPRVVGNASDSSRGQSIRISEEESKYCSNGENGREYKSSKQAQPSMGGNPDGSSRGMGYAELSVSCDNRNDELRLLGNGVVPATSELSFKTLAKKLGIIQ
jgi:DNA (cytosine-5)-methyltransferase 1